MESGFLLTPPYDTAADGKPRSGTSKQAKLAVQLMDAPPAAGNPILKLIL